ncbi:hypothetical protein BTUL_0208g00060 [Botrytis tulipae]|uniref:Uncharacterized protein n=1 Tax=Botrytis tulipae TaxID=87230 RepID=A0A4Z1E8L0_9HELO|nr:hypothetical protein BTUL_0208g00060 [Botrytis tulipae]
MATHNPLSMPNEREAIEVVFLCFSIVSRGVSTAEVRVLSLTRRSCRASIVPALSASAADTTALTSSGTASRLHGFSVSTMGVPLQVLSDRSLLSILDSYNSNLS